MWQTSRFARLLIPEMKIYVVSPATKKSSSNYLVQRSSTLCICWAKKNSWNDDLNLPGEKLGFNCAYYFTLEKLSHFHVPLHECHESDGENAIKLDQFFKHHVRHRHDKKCCRSLKNGILEYFYGTDSSSSSQTICSNPKLQPSHRLAKHFLCLSTGEEKTFLTY